MAAGTGRWLAALFAVVATACGTVPVASPAPPPAPTPSPTRTVAAPVVGAWTDAFSLRLDGGWILSECLGDAADICVRRDSEIVGNLELAEYPLDDEDEDPVEVARGRAEDFLRVFSEDRGRGCADFEFLPDAVQPATVGGKPGVRTGFTLLAADGRTVERVITHYVVHDGALFLVNTDAYVHAGGCLDQSDVDLEFEPDVLADLEPHLDAIVAGTPLPDAAGVG